MAGLAEFLHSNPLAALVALVFSFVALAKSADIFVGAAVSLARRFNVPKLLVGLVLVSLGTTAPELTVSLIAAARGSGGMALGNAFGSVVCNSCLALGLAGLLAPVPIPVNQKLLKPVAVALLAALALVAVCIVPDNALSWRGGLALLAGLCLYLTFMYRGQRDGKFSLPLGEAKEEVVDKSSSHLASLGWFVGGLAGIILSSELVVNSSLALARWSGVPEAIIATTMVAFGTSVPEVASCITAARRGHGDLAVGNILGANILNLTLVTGAASLFNELRISQQQTMFMLPSMLVVLAIMLVALKTERSLNRREGAVLSITYLFYLALSFTLF